MTSKEKSKKFKKNAKLFLNDKPGEGASIRWVVSTNSDSTFEKLNADLIITDCFKQVSLDFNVYQKHESVEERLEKINTMIRALEDFREAFREADRFLLDNPRPKKKKKNKKSEVAEVCER